MTNDKLKEKAVRVGIVGCGKMGANHIRIISEMSGLFELVGIYDPDKEKKTVADSYGVDYYSDYDDFLKQCDAVTVACPTSLHKGMALKAAWGGVHALVEKPIAESLGDTKEILDEFAKQKLVLAVGQVERYNPVVKMAAEIIKDMDIVAIEIHRCSPYDERIYDVDVVSDLMIHDIDILINELLDEYPLEIKAYAKNVYNNRFADYAHAVFSFKKGINAFITTSRATEDKIRLIAVHTKGAYIEADMLNKTLVIKKGVNYELMHASYRQTGITENIYVPLAEPLREEIKNFGYAIRGENSKIVTGEQVLRSMAALETVKGQLYNHG